MRVLRSMLVLIIMLFMTVLAGANVKLRVMAVNPSEDKPQTTPIKIYLPEEVTPGDIVDQGELYLEYDADKKIYYVYNDNIELAPKETKVFEIVIKDVWVVPDSALNSYRIRTSRILDSLSDTDYFTQGNQMAQSIYARLDEISESQSDDSISRERHIGLYRDNLKVEESIKDDIDRLEKLLIYIGGPPAPEMLEESDLKADAPSQTTTWLIIFIIMSFVGLLGLVFFLTWHKQAKLTEDIMLNARKSSFTDFEEESPAGKEEEAGPGM